MDLSIAASPECRAHVPCPTFLFEFLGSTQVLMLVRQVLYCLSYLPSPDIWSLKFENPTPTGQSVTLWKGQSLDSQTRSGPNLFADVP